ncbi:Endo-1,4-beta-xylanase Z [Thalassocella blandensis]|nr:Endo-1,4-beta-xylanase Z [Thalassocella blandensis]
MNSMKSATYYSRLKRVSATAACFWLLGLTSPAVLAQTNLAQGKSISASSVGDVYVAGNANDGNSSTYWESQNNAFPQTLTVDLGGNAQINRAVLKLPDFWGTRVQTISLQTSTNGSNFSNLVSSAAYEFNPANSNAVTIDFGQSNARYVRLSITQNSGWPAGQISEFEVYGDSTTPTERDAFSRIEAESFDAMSGIQTENTTDAGGGANVGWIEQGDWLRFNAVDFGSGAGSVNARVASNNAGGTIEFRVDNVNGPLIGTVHPTNTGGWQQWTTSTGNVSVNGVHDVYLVFVGNGEGLFNINWFEFNEDTISVVPATPQGLTVTGVSSNSVSLSWSNTANASGYRILRNGVVVATVSANTYQDTGLNAATQYQYSIIAYNNVGDSAESNAVTATTSNTGGGGEGENVASGKNATATSAVGHLPASLALDGDQSTYWESNSGAFPQQITVDLGSAHFINEVIMQLPNVQAWSTRTQTIAISGSEDGNQFSNIVSASAYVFNPNSENTARALFNDTRVRYVRLTFTGNTGWPAAQLSELSIIGYPDPVPPLTPSNLTVGGGSDTTVYLSWEQTDGLADSFDVMRDGIVIASVDTTAYLDSGLTPSTTYQYAVRAVNAFGNSSFTNAVNATTLDELPEPEYGDRGASMPYVIYQAEHGVTGGNAQVLTPNRTIGDLAGEASGRSAVTLNNVGDYVEFDTDISTNTLVTRFSIPDAPAGGGQTATLNIYVNGQFEKAITLNSKFAWLYGDEQSPNNNPGSGGPRHIYDEANVMFDRVIAAGSTIRLQKDSENQSQYAIDFISLEHVTPLPNPNPSQYVVPAGFSQQDVQNALDSARMNNMTGVYLPAGTYSTSNKFQVYGKAITVTGAGPWYTRFETPQTQTNTDAGFMVGNTANGSTFANFSFFGNYVSRIDGPGKVFDFNGVSNMTIDNIWAEHTVCLLWGANTHDTTVKNSRIRNLFADGVNFTNGSSGNHLINNEARSTGDDSFALFAATDGAGGIVQNNVYEHLTAMTPWRAAGLAIYGGQGNTYRNIVVEDTLTYSGLTVSSLDFGYAFTGFQSSPTTNLENITLVRAGGHFWGDQVFPALWMFSASSTFRGLRFNGLEIFDPTYAGIMFQTMYTSPTSPSNPVENPIFTNTLISGVRQSADQYSHKSGYAIWCNPLPEAGQGPGIGEATFNGLTLINNQQNIYNPCPDFTFHTNN